MVAAYAQFGSIHEDSYAAPMYASLAKLHAYQSTALQLSFDGWNLDVRRQMVVLPTGTGKTVLFATLPLFHKFSGRILVLVQRDTLAKQAKETIEEWNPYAGPVGIEMGAKYHSSSERIVVASVQTIGKFTSHQNEDGSISYKVSKRLLKFNPEEFDAVIVDECHHSVAPGYKNIFRYFGFLDDHLEKIYPAPDRLLFGVTATPRRLDRIVLSEVYDKKVFEYPIEDAIREGWLVNPRCFRIRTSISLAGVNLSDDDLEKLSKTVNIPARNKLIVKEWQEKAAGRKTICFAVDVKHAVDLAREFRDAGVNATAVWGDDPEKERKLKDFKRGRYQVMTNCEILTEGYDDRSISCVILARPTDSEGLFIQMVGRGMRLEPGVLNLLQAIANGQAVTKHDLLVLEVLDAKATEHNLAMSFAQAYELPDDFDLEGNGLLDAKDAINRLRPRLKKSLSPEDEERALAEVKSMAELVEMVNDRLHATVEEIDLLKVSFDSMVLSKSQLQWHRLSKENYILMMPNNLGYIRLWRNDDGVIVIDGSRLREQHKFLIRGSRRREDFGRGFMAADQQVLRRFGQTIFGTCERNTNSASWKSLPASSAQLGRLKKLYDSHGMHMPEGITRGEASLLITQIMARSAAA
jgi:superfamily II DNA or RNA helicase